MYPTRSAARAAEIYGAGGGASPLDELVRVHDGMIAKLAEARAAIAEGRIEDRFNLTRKVGAVVDVLQMSLDHERGGEIAVNLDRLYSYFTRRLADINVRNDTAACRELEDRLAELRDGWRSVARGTPMPVEQYDTASLSA